MGKSRKNDRGGISTNKQIKLVMWVGSSAVISLFFVDVFLSAPTIFSVSYLQSNGVYSWLIFLLCIFWIFLKKDEIIKKIKWDRLIPSIPFFVLGVIILAVSLGVSEFISTFSFKVLALILSYTAIFAIFFGSAAIVPLALIVIYGFSMSFPFLISFFLEKYYTSLSIWLTASIFKIFGILPLVSGQNFEYFSVSGDKISVLIDSRCSGTASLSVFMALFFLMVLDIRLPTRKAVRLFLFGITGTFMQNILRLLVVLFAGYLYGYKALLSAHTYAGYIIFAVWFSTFTVIYLREAKT
jgi:exosortase/archaeosortase family protein